MVWLVGAVLVLWIAWGPLVLVVAAGLLCVPRVRWWVQDLPSVSRRVVVRTCGVGVVLLALALVAPAGWLPIPPAPGLWAGPTYLGRPAVAVALDAPEIARNPHLSPADPADRPGPLGRQPEVDTGWYGTERCATPLPTSTGQLVLPCTSGGDRSVRLVDPGTLRPTATLDLPDQSDRAGGTACPDPAVYLGVTERVVVAADREVVAVGTMVDGEPGLAAETTWDLRPWIPWGDCIVALAPGWSGRIWWASAAGLVGTFEPSPEPGAERVGVVDLGEHVRRGLAIDEGGAYVVTDEAVHRLVVGTDGTPQPAWRSELNGSSGSAPVLLGGGAVAVTDTAEDRLGVRFLDRTDGTTLCRQPVFDQGDGSTASDLAVVGSGVVVVNNDGYASPRSTLLGRATHPGVARVDLVDGACRLAWTSGLTSPSGGVVVSRATGLLYAWTKRASLAGVSRWYLTAIDADTGRHRWSVRTGTGMLAGNDGAEVALAADGSAYAATLGGVVRVRDRG